jgi:TonB family protein
LGGSYVFDRNASDRKIYVPTASVSAYKSASYWSEYASSIVGYDFDGNPTYTETISDLNMKMVWVEGGSFQMGATSEQSGKAESDEHPAHAVKIDPYYIAECEVTQAQWRKIMGYNPSQFTGNENHPVENVSWDEAAQFCRKLSQLTGKKYVLPTEAQWEYAARGGDQSQGNKYSGNNDSQYVAWYDSNSYSKTNAVKQMLPNELGLYDMSGNVLEWCSDWYNEGYYRISAQNNPTGPTSGTHRVLRGGSWRGSEDNCRVSHRRHGSPTTRSSSIGFRVVCLSTNTNQSTAKTTSTAPSAKESTPDYGEAFVRVEQMPSFNGGTLETFRRWVMHNIQKPNSVKGRVFVQFIIERDGSLTNAKVLQSPHASLSNEALRVIKSSPKWTPGKQRGQAVRVSYTLPIDFR